MEIDERIDRTLTRVTRLADLRPGGRCVVLAVDDTCQGPERRRLLDLGILPGTQIVAEMTGPMGDPTAYRIRDALIALRKEQAELVHITYEKGMER